MPDEKSADQPQDQTLGMNEPICRRDFLNASLLASGGILLKGMTPAQMLAQAEDWTGYGGVGDYAHSNGNTFDVVTAGHRIRDNVFPSLPATTIDTGEDYDLVVVGGGISGLAAALLFHRQTGERLRCLVLDNHPIFGGEAKRNEFEVDGQRLVAHQGSAMFPTPYPYSFIAHFYDLIGMDCTRFQYQKWGGDGKPLPLGQTPYVLSGDQPAAYGYYFGARFGQPNGLWLIDPWGRKLDGAPIPQATKDELLRWRSGVQAPGADFAVPRVAGDAAARRLDAMTLENYIMQRYGISQQTVRDYIGLGEGGGFGLGADALSAYCAYADRELHPLDNGDDTWQMFPGGNTGFARLIVKTLIPNAIPGPHTIENVCFSPVNFSALDQEGSRTRVRLNSTAVWVEHEGKPETSSHVRIAYTRNGKLAMVRARSVVMAGGCWTTKHVVRDLPEHLQQAYGTFYRSPCVMANVAVRNWRFMAKMGISGCSWFEGLGSYTAIRAMPLIGEQTPTISPDSPTVLTVKILYSYPGLPIDQQGHRGRYEVYSTSFRDYERQLRQQFTDMFARSGFDAKRDIGGIIVNRWGHAYVNPQPGFFFGKDGQPAPRDVIRRAPFVRIAFANTDLAGLADHRNSILEAQRAVRQLLDQVLTA